MLLAAFEPASGSAFGSRARFQAHHQAVACGVPGVGVRNQEVEHNSGDGRILLVLLGAEGKNVFLQHRNPLVQRSQARVG